jgi:hypothetical protein
MVTAHRVRGCAGGGGAAACRALAASGNKHNRKVVAAVFISVIVHLPEILTNKLDGSEN